ncbi:N-acetylmuramoyl-L-alanine amidase [Sphingomonas naasensis]|uniref:N-acetylmuramoyl-L-alanine amidase n=1 Tax=Sphingomonas naasensis TaxID=1344951 RepID=A0A4S1WH28_9SPHN|nr:N-acetylmuramoyl-L-alanine amidase [Sphingomonas naasensis]NIJ21894.1 N-acetylmuramoyl-L-alanine amidase [Sphingomonas naasensis]TGX42414.1 N-acetylmuramoyl-L-alanine amidase [Sphingomonas naasensis]
MHLGWTLHGPARHIARVLFLLALLSGWLTGVPSWAGAVQEVRVQGDRVVVKFDAPVARASAFLLAGPQRIALDVSGAEPGRVAITGGAVAKIRQGAQGDGARIVFDLARPAIVSEGSFGSDGRTLTLQLRTVDDERFARAAAERRMSFLPPFTYLQPASRHPYSVAMAVPKRLSRAPLPRVYGAAGKPLVVIDAGHGGHDPGALSNDGGLREKDLTLQVARAVRDSLLASGRVRVALTRDDDRFLVLQERYGLARRLKADLFISIHCDSAGNPEATGATVYTLSEVASDKEAARLAARENKADILAGVDLGAASPDISSILIDLTQRETMNASANFARLLGREAQPLMPIKANYHRMASLMVLKAPDMPSVLFETGYISNSADADFLASSEGQRKVAQSVRKAVEIHFATRMASR